MSSERCAPARNEASSVAMSAAGCPPSVSVWISINRRTSSQRLGLSCAGNPQPMPRPIWSGSITFGLVAVPVRMFLATEKKDVRFHELAKGTGRRVRHRRVAEGSGEEVERAELVKGYELEKGKFVEL